MALDSSPGQVHEGDWEGAGVGDVSVFLLLKAKLGESYMSELIESFILKRHATACVALRTSSGKVMVVYSAIANMHSSDHR